LRVVGLLVGTAFLLYAAAALIRPLRSGKATADLLLYLLAFTALQSSMVLLAGVTRLLSFWPLTAASAVGILVLALRRPPVDLSFLKDLKPRTTAAKAAAACVAVGGLVLLVKTLVFSPYFGDAVFYHLVTVAEWIRAEGIVAFTLSDPRVWLPNGFQLVELWWTVFLRHDALIELGGLQMMAIAGTALVCLAETLGYRRDVAALLFAFMPLVILHVTSCGNDLAAGAMVLSAFALVADRAPRTLQAIPLLIGVGIKPTVAMAAAGVLFYACITPKPERRPVPRTALLLLGLSLALGAFWYGRNAALHGHPTRAMFGGTKEMPLITAVDRASAENLTDNLRHFPAFLRDGRVYETLAGDSTSWGWFILPLAIPLTILSLREDPAFRRLFVAFAVGWLSVLASVEPFSYPLRYALWFPAAFVLGACRVVRTPLLAAAFAASALNFVATVVPEEVHRIGEVHRVPSEVPREAPVAVVYVDCGFTYPLYNADFSRRLVFPRSVEELRASGVRFAYVAGHPEWVKPLLPAWRRVGGRVYEIR
jgi:hypothetical protein